ncbi:MAG: YfhO family protein [bacterium]|nr:YfhO family protein [bacterium]
MTVVPLSWRSVVGPVALFALVAALFVPWWLQGRVFGTFDLASHTIPIEDLFARYQRAGDLPVWTPEIQGGFPMVANGFQSFFYLPHLLLRQALPGVWVANLSLLLHLWLGGLGMWVLLRRERFAPTASFLGALLFSGSGYLVGRVTLPHLLFAAAWVPWILAAVFRLWRAHRLSSFLLVSAAGAAQLFAGHLQVVAYTVLLAAIACGFLFMAQPVRTAVRRLSVVLIVPIAVALLAAVHLLPVAELLPTSLRSERLQGQELFDVSYPSTHLLTWLVPDVFGRQVTYVGAKNEPELMTFFGVAGLLLGLFGVLSKTTWRHPLGRTALAAIAVGFLLAGGEFSLVYRWLVTSVPAFTHLANPGRAILLVHTGWSVLAAFGLAALSSWSLRGRLGRLLLVLSVVIVGAWRLVVALPDETRGMALERMSAAGAGIAVAGAAVAVAVLLRRVAGVPQPLLLAVITVVELLVLGTRVNPRVEARGFKGTPRVETYVSRAAPAPRIYTHSTLSTGSRPDPGLDVGPLVRKNEVLAQQLLARQNGLLGADVQLTWDGTPVTEGSVQLSVTDRTGAVVRTASVPGSTVLDGEPVRFLFAPLPQSQDQSFALQLTSTYARDTAPHALVFLNPPGTDFNPTGRLEQCRSNRCEPAASAGPKDADLAVRLRYQSPPAFFIDRELLLSFFGESLGWEMTYGVIQLQLASVARYQYEMGERRVSSTDNPFLVRHKTLFDRFSIGTFLASFEEHEGLDGIPGLQRTALLPVGNREIHVYENVDAFPKLHFAERFREVPDTDAALQALIRGEVGSDEVVVARPPISSDVVEDPLGSVRSTFGADDRGARMTVQTRTPRRIVVETDSTRPRLLVLRDVLAPGWRAYLDGARTPIYLTDVIFRGVVVPAGTHQVTFSYHPRAFVQGAVVSASAWGLLVLAAWFLRIARRKSWLER